MDLDTENKIAAMLMREAAELRRQAEKEGVQAYLNNPKVRGRPNSRFLTATVRGVQQANRAVEVSEMWKVRQKEIELEKKIQGRTRDGSSHRRHEERSPFSSSGHRETEKTDDDLCTSSKRSIEECYLNKDGSGLRDEEVEEFLHSRVKRGRGAIGSRMDETGPYLPPLHSDDSTGKVLAGSEDVRVKEDWEHRVLGPEKPSSLKKSSFESFRDSSDEEGTWKKVRKVKPVSSSKKQHSEKKKSKDKSRDRKKSKKSKHHHRSRSR